MGNLPLVDKNEAPAEIQATLKEVEKKFGFIPNLVKVLASSPTSLNAYLSLSDLMEKSSLTPQEQQIVLLTVSRDNQCGYCKSAHSMIAEKVAGLPKAEITAVLENTPMSNAKHQALATFTSEMIQKRGFATPEQVETFKKAGFSEQHVLDVITGIAMKTISNYTNHLAETPVDPQFTSS